jgi:uroporphyrin-III C-methyltransferase/precorrin-2 dehydrogenase/sirohydrochlorin ferrochelatase
MPLFVNLSVRRVVLVGGGRVAVAKLKLLIAAMADVLVVAPTVDAEISAAGVPVVLRPFVPADLDGAWLAVAAATPEVNREVAAAGEARRVLVNAVDDPGNATAFLGGVVRRGGMTLAISSNGEAPALTALLKEALDALLPGDLRAWVRTTGVERRRWRSSGVPVGQRKGLLLDALNALYAREPDDADRRAAVTALGSGPGGGSPVRRHPQPASFQGHSKGAPVNGRVSIVGAGPGDPALLTRKAAARLRRADLVLYDALVDPRVLRFARKARRFFVGKRAGRHAMRQEAIHALMIRAAQRGRRVVRLKGGDPFVYGRGAEEVLALRAAGVTVDVVPGISSAIAAPAAAGIPVTHRGLASAFLVTSGHDLESFARNVAAAHPGAITLVVLMGFARRAEVARRLIAMGWPAETPAAVVVDASTAHQQTWSGCLADLGCADPTHCGGAGTIVVGDVVSIADRAQVVGGRALPLGSLMHRSAGGSGR